MADLSTQKFDALQFDANRRKLMGLMRDLLADVERRLPELAQETEELEFSVTATTLGSSGGTSIVWEWRR